MNRKADALPEAIGRWRSLAALNAVSALAQIGQYGLGTTLLPLALQARGASAWQIGLASSALWLGMLAGLQGAGPLVQRLGYRLTVVLGLVLSALAFMVTPWLPWTAWLLPAAVIGFGLGLRWIANETWLYRLAPASAQGRVVGLHETLIGLAAIAGPMIVAALGALRSDAFLVAAAMCGLALPPLWAATPLPPEPPPTPDAAAPPVLRPSLSTRLQAISLGAWLAGLGGWVEGALLALLPVYTRDLGLSATDTAWLFTLLGLGATLCQLPIGWLADHAGVATTARLLTGLLGASTLLELVLRQPSSLSLMVFTLGAATAGLLTLGMVHAAQGGDAAVITARVRQVSMTYTLLSAAGPLAAGAVLDALGNSTWLMGLQLAACLVLAGLLRPGRSRHPRESGS